ncbi:hypothetical protein J6590_095960 [Homalodisca vitripennis]|nr:hypothetical protein J6590_095960 [Homalodisca vitripennis]
MIALHWSVQYHCLYAAIGRNTSHHVAQMNNVSPLGGVGRPGAELTAEHFQQRRTCVEPFIVAVPVPTRIIPLTNLARHT